ncbi:MAG: hypothetical protein ACOC16_01295 [Nanoarchaeota archaeon]
MVNFKFNKKCISLYFLVILIVSLVSLVVLIFFITSVMEDSKYDNSIIECQSFLKGIHGQTTYFGEHYNSFQPKLINSIATLCSLKQVEIDDENIKLAVDLVEDCWRKSGPGKDILPQGAHEMNLCILCGEIEAMEDVNDFDERLNRELDKNDYIFSNDIESINLNKPLFKSNYLPSKLEKNQKISVFYYIEKPYIKPENINFKTYFDDTLGRTLRDFIGSSQRGKILNNILLNDVLVGEFVSTYAGVVLTSNKEYDLSDFDNIQHNIDYRDCFVIIPNEKYN